MHMAGISSQCLLNIGSGNKASNRHHHQRMDEYEGDYDSGGSGLEMVHIADVWDMLGE